MVHVNPGEEILASHMNAKLDADGSDYRATADFVPNTTDNLNLGNINFKWQNLHLDKGVYLEETSEPSTPPSGQAVIYLYNNSGTQELRIKFANGTVKTITNST